MLDVGNRVCINIDGVEKNTVYFFAVTAYDLVGNESSYSQEVSVLIPGEGTSLLGVVVNWVLTIVSEVTSHNTGVREYGLDEFSMFNDADQIDSISPVQIVNSDLDSSDALPAAQTQDGYVVLDVLLETAAVLDLSDLYPVGTYVFVSLTEQTPDIVQSIIYAYESGVCLYMVADSEGNFINILRVSVVDDLCYAAQFLPGSDMVIDAIEDGISLIIPQDGLNGSIPIGIGCEGIVHSGSAVQSINDTNAILFDVVPYGLALSAPAQISAVYDGDYPVVVEFYDDRQKKWVLVEDVQELDNMVTFSTEILGSFRIYSAAGSRGNTMPEAFTYESSAGGGCFVALVSEMPPRRYQIIVSLLVAVLAICSSVRYLLPR